MRVLIVDDEEPLRKLLQHWVEAEGATVIEAGTAEEGLALAQSGGAPAVALCDIRLPGKDGLWLAEQLHIGFPETVVLMTTGVLEFNAAVHSLQSGVMDYLVKPFSRERLTEAVNRAFFAHKSRRAITDMQRELDERRAQIAEALGNLEMNAAASLEAMLAMLRVRDAHSYDHAHRVAKLSVNLAMALRISEPQLSDIERAALLHNLGRLALPDSILVRKERSLSDEERAKLRSYPLHGQAMLKNVPFLVGANEGEAIPIGARIVAVADVWDELVSGIGDTPVAPAHALEIMTVDRLAQFDPLVLGALTMLQLSATQTPAS
jgi:response regulator RpfG family c-di-GMP phosphodiesterase